jgi:hypothetical protein
MVINKRLVLGNGFDRYLGMSTSYEEYFNFKLRNDNDYILFHSMLEKAKVRNAYGPIALDEKLFTTTIRQLSDGFSLWDAYFLLLNWIFLKYPQDENAFGTNKKWSDVESQINHFLIANQTNEKLNFENVILELLNEILMPNYGKDIKIANGVSYCDFLALFIHHFSNRGNEITFENSYEFCFNELQKFEKSFSAYIKNLEDTNPQYDVNAKNFAGDLLGGLDRYAEIDSFNFTKFDIGEDSLFKNIHGVASSNSSGIFGIDGNLDSNPISTSDKRYVFTKTIRELELEINGNQSVSVNTPPNSVIIFGHSLNEQDQSYFFDLFDFIELADPKQRRSVTFAFCIYDDNLAAEIKKDQLMSATGLINRYQQNRRIVGPNGSLLSMLLHSGKIGFRNIPKR